MYPGQSKTDNIERGKAGHHIAESVVCVIMSCQTKLLKFFRTQEHNTPCRQNKPCHKKIEEAYFTLFYSSASIQ